MSNVRGSANASAWRPFTLSLMCILDTMTPPCRLARARFGTLDRAPNHDTGNMGAEIDRVALIGRRLGDRRRPANRLGDGSFVEARAHQRLSSSCREEWGW